jgi:orotate phosphoribosyltransferase
VLLVEDLTTDGGSKLSFVEAIRETGASCGHTAVIFYYGIFPETETRWPSMACGCTTSAPGGTCWPRRARRRFDAATLDAVEAFLRARARLAAATAAEPGGKL